MIIYKYILTVTDRQTLTLPEGYKILCVKNQGGAICLWVLVSPEEPPVEVEIIISGIGEVVDPNQQWDYLGTVLIEPYVWHVFKASLRPWT